MPKRFSHCVQGNSPSSEMLGVRLPLVAVFRLLPPPPSRPPKGGWWLASLIMSRASDPLKKLDVSMEVSKLLWLPSVATIGWAKLAKSSKDKCMALSPESIRDEVSNKLRDSSNIKSCSSSLLNIRTGSCFMSKGWPWLRWLEPGKLGPSSPWWPLEPNERSD